MSEFKNQNQYSWQQCHFSVRDLARFKEQPAHCSLSCCGNRRRWDGPSIQERKHEIDVEE